MATNPFYKTLELDPNAYASGTPDLGAAIGEKFSAGFAHSFQQNQANKAAAAYDEAERQRAAAERIKKTNAFREVILKTPNAPQYLQDLASDAEVFANTFGDPKTAGVANTVLKQLPGNKTRRIVVDSENPLNTQFNLGIGKGERTRVDLELDPEGTVLNASLASSTEKAGEDGAVENLTPGRALAFIAQTVPLLQAGQSLSPQQQAMFSAASAVVRSPVARYNPITQEVEQTTLTLDPLLEQFVPQLGNSNNAPAGTGQSAAPTDAGSPGAPQQTLAELVLEGNLQGITPAIRRVGEKLPGGLALEGTQATAAAQELALINDDLIEAKRRNPKYTDADYASLQKTFGLEPKLVGNEDEMLARIVEVQKDLEKDIKEHAAALAGTLSKTDRAKRIDGLKRAELMIPRLGPQRLDNQQEIDEFFASNPAPGTKVLVHDGKKWRIVAVPEQTGNAP